MGGTGKKAESGITKEGVIEERLRRIKKLIFVRQRAYAYKPNGRGKEEQTLRKERCLRAGSSLRRRTGWIESQTGIVSNMGQETGTGTCWEAEREIKQGAKHTEHVDGNNTGRMMTLKMRKQLWVLGPES